jgi:hypothetical protein
MFEIDASFRSIALKDMFGCVKLFHISYNRLAMRRRVIQYLIELYFASSLLFACDANFYP